MRPLGGLAFDYRPVAPAMSRMSPGDSFALLRPTSGNRVADRPAIAVEPHRTPSHRLAGAPQAGRLCLDARDAATRHIRDAPVG